MCNGRLTWQRWMVARRQLRRRELRRCRGAAVTAVGAVVAMSPRGAAAARRTATAGGARIITASGIGILSSGGHVDRLTVAAVLALRFVKMLGGRWGMYWAGLRSPPRGGFELVALTDDRGESCDSEESGSTITEGPNREGPEGRGERGGTPG